MKTPKKLIYIQRPLKIISGLNVIFILYLFFFFYSQYIDPTLLESLSSDSPSYINDPGYQEHIRGDIEKIKASAYEASTYLPFLLMFLGSALYGIITYFLATLLEEGKKNAYIGAFVVSILITPSPLIILAIIMFNGLFDKEVKKFCGI